MARRSCEAGGSGRDDLQIEMGSRAMEIISLGVRWVPIEEKERRYGNENCEDHAR